MYKIPIYQPALIGNEKKYVVDCIDSNWISSKGKYVPLFETRFAEYIDCIYSVAVCNGTCALHLALIALGIGEGDEVIVPTLTYIASVNAISYTGARPVFVDSLPGTWQMDPENVKKKITNRTKAVMAVHLYGHPCDMGALKKIANDNNIFLIEDCAEAIGSLYKSQHVGTFGDIAAFSFYGNKTLTTGEGGMLVTDDKTLFKRANHIKGQGLAKYREYWHDIIGYNYRMTNICAAIGLAQLEQVDKIVEKKRRVAAMYKELLMDTDLSFHNEDQDVFHTYWMFSVLVPMANQREAIRKSMAKAGIETRPVFYPVHTMPMYSQKYQRYKAAEDIGWRGINLPSYPTLSDDQIKYVCSQLKVALEK